MADSLVGENDHFAYGPCCRSSYLRAPQDSYTAINFADIKMERRWTDSFLIELMTALVKGLALSVV